jgi:hypothetical protein
MERETPITRIITKLNKVESTIGTLVQIREIRVRFGVN